MPGCGRTGYEFPTRYSAEYDSARGGFDDGEDRHRRVERVPSRVGLAVHHHYRLARQPVSGPRHDARFDVIGQRVEQQRPQELDRGPKPQAYQALPSLFEYLLVSQDVPHITHYFRQKDTWLRSDYGGLDARIELPSIECTLALSELYQDVEFP